MTAPGSEGAAAARRRYDRATGRFVRLGQGGASIHRAVFGPGVSSRAEAFHHVEERLLRLLEPVPRPRVVDLGCGVGASLVHLAGRRLALRGDGITISPVQVAAGTRAIAAAGLGDRLAVHEGDFLAPPAALAGADLAFAIEAFVHAADAAAFLRAAAGLVRPGGLVAICDDVLTADGAAATGRATGHVAAFREGWRIGSLLPAATIAALAGDAGLAVVGDVDLTPWLALGRPRDRAVRVLVAATRPFRRGEYLQALAGGDALQRCLAAGLVEYRLLVFRAT